MYLRLLNQGYAYRFLEWFRRESVGINFNNNFRNTRNCVYCFRRTAYSDIFNSRNFAFDIPLGGIEK